jgi:hypothetical protein
MRDAALVSAYEVLEHMHIICITYLCSKMNSMTS